MSETVKNMIKACIVSRKGGMPLHDINNDYKELVGENIPYAALGYRNLEDFLKSIDFVNITRQFAGDSILKVSDPKVTHIDNLVSKQKNPTNRNPKYKGKNKRRRYNNRKDRVQPGHRADNNRIQPNNRANNNHVQLENKANNNYIQFDNTTNNYRVQSDCRENFNRAANINPPRRNESSPNVPFDRREKFGGNMRAEYAQSKWCPHKPNSRETMRQARTENREMNRFNNFNAGRMGIQNYYETSPRTYYGNSWDYESHFAYMASRDSNMYYYQSQQEMRYANDTNRSWGYHGRGPYYSGNVPVAFW